MVDSKAFRMYVWVVLMTIYAVIIAGSVVRTTQSGMGCPDWPTCFGKAIPPTDSLQVVFQPNYSYKKGQFIIHNDSLKYAVEKFTSGTHYDSHNWKQYEKHNYAKFEVINTWIEYINRLLGALLGLLILVQLGWSFLYFKQRPLVVLLSFGLVLLTGFQAWLGKTVVDSNLELMKITLHLFGALAMVLLNVYILFLIKGKRRASANKGAISANVMLLLLVFVQIMAGTQVRGQVDKLVEFGQYLDRSGWVSQLNGWFYFHRTFSLFVGALAVYVYLKAKSVRRPRASILAQNVIIVIGIEILVGVTMTYLDFPKVSQTLHLFLSSVLVALIFNNVLRFKIKT